MQAALTRLSVDAVKDFRWGESGERGERGLDGDNGGCTHTAGCAQAHKAEDGSRACCLQLGVVSAEAGTVCVGCSPYADPQRAWALTVAAKMAWAVEGESGEGPTDAGTGALSWRPATASSKSVFTCNKRVHIDDPEALGHVQGTATASTQRPLPWTT